MSDTTVEQRGLEEFIAARGPRLWRAAWLLVGDRHHAEDLVQTALSNCYTRYDSFADDAVFEAYVRTAIYRTFVSWWRRKSWKGEYTVESIPECHDGDHGAQAAQRLDVMRALEALPRMQRAVIILQYLEDRSVKDIAEELGISVGSVKTYASRGRVALRKSGHLS